MAKRFVDCAPGDLVSGIANQDGVALTLTNATGVRVLFDDSATSIQIQTALEKAKLAIIAIKE